MKRLFLLLPIVAVFCFGFLQPTYAARDIIKDIGQQLGAGAGAQGADFGAAVDPRLVFAKVVQVILSLLGTIFVVLTIMGGYKYFTAQGDDEKAKTGTKIIQGAIIGFIVVLISYSITSYVIGRIGGAVEQGTRVLQ